MQNKLLFYVIIFIISTLTISSLLPYPILSPYTNINQQNAYEINNYNETEIQNYYKTNPKILDLDFSDINSLLPDKFIIIDIDSEEYLNAMRIGGNNHADITLDNESEKILHEICGGWTWDRRPVLVKLNETAYLPASLICYPHGFNNHFCLHFKNSRMHGTNKKDEEAQKAISFALRKGANLIF